MSNTRNTPVEALELELPLRVTRVRACAAAAAARAALRGGDGVVREVEALEDMTYSLITERRRHAPPGAEGGADGAHGAQRASTARRSPAKASGTLHAGERLRLETPGGGGFGRAHVRGRPHARQTKGSEPRARVDGP